MPVLLQRFMWFVRGLHQPLQRLVETLLRFFVVLLGGVLDMDKFAPFESPRLIVDMAEERISDLEAICQPFIEGCDYDLITHSDPKTRDKIVKLRLKRRLPPKISILTSGIINDLRHALDQAVCSAGEVLQTGRPDKLYFPVGKDPEDLDREIKRRCRDLHPEIIDLCRNFQPHYDGDRTLWGMARLAVKKHRHLLSVALEDQGSFVKAIISAKGPLSLIINRWSEFHNELEVARLPPDSQIQIDGNFRLSFKVLFGRAADPFEFRPLFPALREFARKTQGIVMAIEAETDRLIRERSA